MPVSDVRYDVPGQAPDRSLVIEFYWLWFLAALTYGAGDTVTSIAILGFNPSVSEANVLIRLLVSRLGFGGLVGLKLAVFSCCLLLSDTPDSLNRGPIGYYAPPIVLTLVGAFTTAYNAHLLGW